MSGDNKAVARVPYFKDKERQLFAFDMYLQGYSSNEIAKGYAERWPDQGKPSARTVGRFLEDHPEEFKAAIANLSTIPLANVKVRLLIMQGVIRRILETLEGMKAAGDDNKGEYAKLVRALKECVDLSAVMAGDNGGKPGRGTAQMKSGQVDAATGAKPLIFGDVQINQYVTQVLEATVDESRNRDSKSVRGGAPLSRLLDTEGVIPE